MRRTGLVAAIAVTCVMAGAALAAGAPGSAAAPAPDDGRFLYDGVDPVRRGFDANSPVLRMQRDRLVVAQNEAHPPEIIRETPQVSLNGVRVAGPDSVALAEFYKDAFGMMEVQRIPTGAQPEIMLNFGATMEAALANPNGDVVVYPFDGDVPEYPAPHLVFDVSDAAQVAQNVETFGGTIVRAPTAFGDSGIVIAMVADPAGNQIELIQPRGRARPE